MGHQGPKDSWEPGTGKYIRFYDRGQGILPYWVSFEMFILSVDYEHINISYHKIIASVAYYLLSTKSKELFQRGILQSGTALGITWGGYISADKAFEYSDLFTSGLVCPGGTFLAKEMTDIFVETHLLDIPKDELLNFGST